MNGQGIFSEDRDLRKMLGDEQYRKIMLDRMSQANDTYNKRIGLEAPNQPKKDVEPPLARDGRMSEGTVNPPARNKPGMQRNLKHRMRI